MKKKIIVASSLVATIIGVSVAYGMGKEEPVVTNMPVIADAPVKVISNAVSRDVYTTVDSGVKPKYDLSSYNQYVAAQEEKEVAAKKPHYGSVSSALVGNEKALDSKNIVTVGGTEVNSLAEPPAKLNIVSAVGDEVGEYKEYTAPVITTPSYNKLDADKELGEPVRLGYYTATAYDLGFASCEKHLGDPGYGHTAGGYNLKGKSWSESMVVAVDPSVIPLGSKLYVEFDGARSKYTGIYTAADIGGGIKGNHIDVFMGDFNMEETSQEALNFGKVDDARVYIYK